MINNVKFANGIVYEHISGVKYGSSLWYNGQNAPKYKIVTPIALGALPPTEIEKEIELFKSVDGSKVYLIYTLITEETALEYVATINARVRADDKNGSAIFESTNVRDVVRAVKATMSTPPFSDMYYTPSFIDYRSGDTPTVLNDPASSIFVYGALWYKKAIEPLGGYTNFIDGAYDVTDFAKSYQYWMPIDPITTDQGLSDFVNAADPGGVWITLDEVPPENPDPSGTGGGDRPHGGAGDPVDFPDLPSTNVLTSGLVTAYNPSDAQLRSLAAKLWSSDFEETISKILNDPFDGIIGLSLIPFTPTTSGSVSCEIGNYDSEISMPIVSAQYYTLDCGTVTIPENWNNALDYNSTSAEIYIPFVGFRTISIQDCMDMTLALKYNVDILSGAAIAILKCGDKCLYTWPCKLSYDVPLTGSNKAALYTGMINIAMSGLTAGAAGGAMGAVAGAASSAINVATHKQSDVERSGAITSNTGVMGDFTPYIVLHRPVQSMPANFKTIKGYESNITAILGNCRGFTEVDYIHLTGIDGATDEELTEIERLLKSGVII